jgi:nucleoside-diphosphate-sugar epimerase
MTDVRADAAPRDESELEERLSAPTTGVIDALRRSPGDIVILGAAGKMGPTLARMARRALDALGSGDRVIAVSRFSTPDAERWLREHGVDTIRCDLLDRAAVARLPEAPNVVFMAGQKFGTRGAPALTWAMNTLVPAICAERYASSRIVAFSTGNVYPLTPVGRGGSREGDELGPVGEYASSCVGRERMLELWSARAGTRVAIVRLNYAVDLRYGVLVDIASKVLHGDPVDVRMGWVNVIWQGDANAWALECIPHASSPPFVVNVTGTETLSVRALAREFGERFGRAPVITGDEAPDALLSDASRAAALFGPPTVPAGTLVDWVASWLRGGGPLLGKPTHFEERTGTF